MKRTRAYDNYLSNVIILILIDGFLQLMIIVKEISHEDCHNPYFNRWFSAIDIELINSEIFNSHNPYFNRWFSAIISQCKFQHIKKESQSLF